VVMVLVKAVSVDLNDAAVPREFRPCRASVEVVRDAERWFGAAGVCVTERRGLGVQEGGCQD
jgi:hypothetical protein